MPLETHNMKPILRFFLPLALAALSLAPHRATAQPATVMADPTTGALFRPAASTFISGNSLLTTTGAAAAYQPLDSDLTAIAALTTTANGRSLLTSSALTLAGLGITNGTTLDTIGAKTQTGTGNLVLATSPTFTTPNIGAATGTSLALSGAISGVTTLSASGVVTFTNATAGTSTTSAAILGKSMGLTENLFVGGTGNFVGDAIVTGTAQSVFRATAMNNNGIAGTVLTTGNGGSLQAWLVGSNISGASGEFAIRDSTGTSNALTITKGTLAATFGGVTVLKNYTVATLPAAASYTYGTACVSDATNAAGTGAGTAPTGGGSVRRMVYSNGTSWLLL